MPFFFFFLYFHTYTFTRAIYISGGYAAKSWRSQRGFIYDSAAFLFALTPEPKKMPCTRLTEKALFCDENYGPTFGAGPDMCIYGNCMVSNICTHANDVGYTYTRLLDAYLDGKKYFQVAALEVYKLKWSESV